MDPGSETTGGDGPGHRPAQSGKDTTEIVCIIDRSGSMESIRSDVIGGFNTFLRRQQEVAGAARLTLVLFDNEYLVPHSGVPVGDVPLLTTETYVPRGMTALYDAIGRAVNETAARLASIPVAQRSQKVIVAILTDGYENASQEFSQPVIRDMITRYTSDLHWDFLYLAANQDAFLESAKIGIAQDFAKDFSADGAGVCECMNDISNAVELKRIDGDVREWKRRSSAAGPGNGPYGGNRPPRSRKKPAGKSREPKNTG